MLLWYDACDVRGCRLVWCLFWDRADKGRCWIDKVWVIPVGLHVCLLTPSRSSGKDGGIEGRGGDEPLNQK
jgi:hypothetical protein